MGFEIYIEHVTKKVKNKGLILDNVNLKINAGTFTALIGPSGAGKTTLLNVLGGYDKKYQGSIYYDNYLSKEQDLREFISYVPQREILHGHLTMYDEIWYMAKLRLNQMNKEQIEEKIKSIIKSLELEGKENTYIKNLSGGEKRRLSIALELLTSPKVLILDEPTSGLDLHIAKKLMQLLKKISKSGTTVVFSAHTTSNLDLCDEVIFMGNGGKICGMMPYESSFSYFNVTQFVDIYPLLIHNQDEYFVPYQTQFSFLHKKKQTKTSLPHINIFKQIYYLSKRYFQIIKNDKTLLFLIIFQSMVIALLFNLAVSSDGLKSYESAKIVLFATTCAAMWIGLFNSIQEIVKEKNIVKREYMSCISLNAYVISKILILGMICLMQSILFIGTISLHFELPKTGLIFSCLLIENITHFFLISFSSCMLGLSFSSFVKKQEYTLIVAIIYMLIQLLFSGILLPLKGFASCLSNFALGKYAIQTFGTSMNLIKVVKTTKLNGYLPEQISIDLFLNEAQEFFTYTKENILSIWGILIFLALIFIIASFYLVNRFIRNME